MFRLVFPIKSVVTNVSAYCYFLLCHGLEFMTELIHLSIYILLYAFVLSLLFPLNLSSLLWVTMCSSCAAWNDAWVTVDCQANPHFSGSQYILQHVGHLKSWWIAVRSFDGDLQWLYDSCTSRDDNKDFSASAWRCRYCSAHHDSKSCVVILGVDSPFICCYRTLDSEHD